MIKPGPAGPPGLQGQQGDQGPPGNGLQTFYYHKEVSEDPPGYAGLELIAENLSQVDKSATVINSSGTKEIYRFITPVGYVHNGIINSGVWRFHSYVYVSSSTSTTTYNYSVYNVSSTGTLTKLFQVLSGDINSLTSTENIVLYNQNSNIYLEESDRIAVIVSVATTRTSNVAAHFVYDGYLSRSSIQTPFNMADNG